MLWRIHGTKSFNGGHKLESKWLFARSLVMSFLEKRPAKFTDKVSQDMPPFYPWWTERKYS